MIKELTKWTAICGLAVGMVGCAAESAEEPTEPVATDEAALTSSSLHLYQGTYTFKNKHNACLTQAGDRASEIPCIGQKFDVYRGSAGGFNICAPGTLSATSYWYAPRLTYGLRYTAYCLRGGEGFDRINVRFRTHIVYETYPVANMVGQWSPESGGIIAWNGDKKLKFTAQGQVYLAGIAKYLNPYIYDGQQWTQQ